MFNGCQWQLVSNGVKILRYCSILLFLAMLVSGCTGRQSWKKSWEKTQVKDLLPEDRYGDKNSSIINLYIYVFEIDKEKYPLVLNAIKDVNNLPVKYKDSGSFLSNGLIGGGGNRTTWAKFSQVLSKAQVRMTKRTSFYMNENMDNDIVIAELAQPGSICYRSGGGVSAGIGLPAGTVALRLNAKPLIGLKQICGLDITPVYKTNIAADKNKKAQKNSGWEFVFDEIAINVPIRPGQFVCIAPDTAGFSSRFIGSPPAAGEMIFCSAKPKPVVRLCLVACSLINN